MKSTFLRATRTALFASSIALVAVGAVVACGLSSTANAENRALNSEELSGWLLVTFAAPTVGAIGCAAASSIHTSNEAN